MNNCPRSCAALSRDPVLNLVTEGTGAMKDCRRPIVSPLSLRTAYFFGRIANTGFSNAAATIALANLRRRLNSLMML